MDMKETMKLPLLLKGRKVSETFMDYCEPFLISLLDDGVDHTPAEIKHILRFPWYVWNAIVLNKRKGNKVDYVQMLESLLKNSPLEARRIIESLKVRKERDFDHYNYMLGEYSVYFGEQNHEIRIRVEARVPPEDSL